MKEVTLPSGAILRVDPAPFGSAKKLWQCTLEELKKSKVDAETNLDVNFFKDIFCVSFSSKEMDAAISDCSKRCLYNNLKISDELFEKPEAREDFISVQFEVWAENVAPFMKGLSAKFATMFERVRSFLA